MLFKKIRLFLLRRFVSCGLQDVAVLLGTLITLLIRILLGRTLPILDVNLLSLIPFASGLYEGSIFDDSIASSDLYEHSLLRFHERSSSVAKQFKIFINLAGARSSALHSHLDRIQYIQQLYLHSKQYLIDAQFVVLEPATKTQKKMVQALSLVMEDRTNLLPRIKFIDSRDLSILMKEIDSCDYFIGREGADAILAVLVGIPSTFYIDDGSHKFPLLKKTMFTYTSFGDIRPTCHHLQFITVSSKDSQKVIKVSSHQSTIDDVISHISLFYHHS